MVIPTSKALVMWMKNSNRGWPDESYRHALAARGIRTRGIKRVDVPVAMYIDDEPIHWIYDRDNDEYVLRTDMDDPSSEFAKVSRIKRGTWAAFAGIPHGPTEEFEVLEDAMNFVVRYYGQVERMVMR